MNSPAVPGRFSLVERFNQSLKYERLYRDEITDDQHLVEHVTAHLDEYNRMRPHETLGFHTPLSAYLAPIIYDETPAILSKNLDAGHEASRSTAYGSLRLPSPTRFRS